MSYPGDVLAERVGEFIALRRDIHRYPELAFEEHRPSDLVAAKLAGWQAGVTRYIAAWPARVWWVCSGKAKADEAWAFARIWMHYRFTRPLALNGPAASRA